MCRELVDIFKKIEIEISYNVGNLYATWAKQDVQSGSCPFEIAYDLPGTVVMDNDDFKDDTLTGANTSHRTNVMFVSKGPKNYIRLVEQSSTLQNHQESCATCKEKLQYSNKSN